MTALPFDPADLLRRVWRTSTDQPGWAVLTPAEPLDSFALRRAMVRVLAALSTEAERAGRPAFVVERVGRFDQQVSTRFHRDGGPVGSLLMLGYEPSRVVSRFFVADAARAAEAAGMGVNAFLTANNPLRPAGEAALANVTTELSWPTDRGAIVIVNNSLYPDGEPGRPLGLLHKGLIPHPDPTATRVINSLGAMPADEPGRVSLPAEVVEEFVRRTGLD
ncbi:MAG: hypothetical protein MUF18_12530 [Fimbriiglobus sp.]|jgi:hypothetical protein|nr:hypothetical protein [Fimbriiglobus sp.]